MPLDLALLSTLIGSNYPCLELILMVPKVFEPMKFYCIYSDLTKTLSHVLNKGNHTSFSLGNVNEDSYKNLRCMDTPQWFFYLFNQRERLLCLPVCSPRRGISSKMGSAHEEKICSKGIKLFSFRIWPRWQRSQKKNRKQQSFYRLNLLHTERLKLHTIFAYLSAIGFKFTYSS